MANPGDWLIPAWLEIEILGEIIMQATPDTEFIGSGAAEGLKSLRFTERNYYEKTNCRT